LALGLQTVGHVGCGFDLEAFLNGLNRRQGNVAAAHDGLNLLTTVGKKQGSFAVEGVGAPNGSGFEAGGG